MKKLLTLLLLIPVLASAQFTPGTNVAGQIQRNSLSGWIRYLQGANEARLALYSDIPTVPPKVVVSGDTLLQNSTIISDQFNRSSLGANYTSVLSTASLTFPSSAYMTATGGDNSNANYIQYVNTFQTGAYSVRMDFVPTTSGAGSNGIGVAFKSNVSGNRASIYSKIDLTSANAASFAVYSDSTVNNTITSGSGNLTFATGDTLSFMIRRKFLSFEYVLLNRSNGTYINSTYTYYTGTASAPFAPNLGFPRIYFYGGTQNVTLFQIVDNTKQGGGTIFLGDSITEGYNATTQNSTYPFVVFNGNTLLFDVYAGVGETSFNAASRLPRILAANPDYVVVNIGVNGRSGAFLTTDITNIVTTLQGAGITPILVSLTPQNSENVTAKNALIQAVATTYGVQYIDTFTPLTGGSGTTMLPIYNADGIHPNDAGMGIIATTIKNAAPYLFDFNENQVVLNRLPKAENTDYIMGINDDGKVKAISSNGFNMWKRYGASNTFITPLKTSDNIYIGTPSTGATSNPSKINMGGSFNSTGNDPANAKIVLTDPGTSNKYGFGVSFANGVEYFGGPVAKHTFYGNIISPTLVTPNIGVATATSITNNGAYNGLGTGNSSFAGRLALGAASSSINFRNGLDITGGSTAYGNLTQSTIQSGVTTLAYGYGTNLSTVASAFTLPLLVHYNASELTFGSGSTVTEQIGFRALSTMTGATTNKGFVGAINAAANRWNIHMSGTAQNWMAGRLGLGTGKSVPTEVLDVAGNGLFSGTLTASNLSGTNTGDQTNITGNAGTATTLANSRTIWGQSFNGSGNVTGALTSVTDITSSGTINTATLNASSAITNNSAAYSTGGLLPLVKNISNNNYQTGTVTGTGSEFVLSASPAFTGTPTAPTAAPGTNTTQIATSAFVQAALSGYTPSNVWTTNTTQTGMSGDKTTSGSLNSSSGGGVASMVGSANPNLSLSRAAIGNAAAISYLTVSTSKWEVGLRSSSDNYVIRNAATNTNAVVVDATTSDVAFSGNITAANFLTGSATLDFPNVLMNQNATLTVTVTGAAVGDVVTLGLPNSILSGMTAYNGSFQAWVSATNIVSIRFQNSDPMSAHDLASATFNIRVTKQ